MVWVSVLVACTQFDCSYQAKTPTAVIFVSADTILGHLDSRHIANVDWLNTFGLQDLARITNYMFPKNRTTMLQIFVDYSP